MPLVFQLIHGFTEATSDESQEAILKEEREGEKANVCQTTQEHDI